MAIYLDYAATTPMTETAINTYSEIARNVYGNSASLHDAGGKASFYIEQARKIIAEKLDVHTDGVVFTGSGTEGNILAILSLARAHKGTHLITTIAEHTSVHAAMATAQNAGYSITKVPLQSNGIVNLEHLRAAIGPETSVISIQHVNSEIGAIQPILQIIALAKKHNIFVHVDCVQSFCKLPIAPFSCDVDAITVSAHKIGGPKGCGAVYINPKLVVAPLIPGVTHERGLRGGTLDTPAIVAFAAAVTTFHDDASYYQFLRDELKQLLPPTIHLVNCEQQLPSICGLLIEKLEGQYVLMKLNEAGIHISTGSACDIHSETGIKAILAIGYSLDRARCFFRISFGPSTTKEEIHLLVHTLKQV